LATTPCSVPVAARVVPDSFTHGTSAQRQRWFNRPEKRQRQGV
jgi:hypothetical protein